MTADGSRWRRSDQVALVESEGRVALLNLDRLAQPPVVLEGTAAAIWQAIDGDREGVEIAEAVAAAYEQPVDTVIEQVSAFLSQLADLGLAVTDEVQPDD